MKLILARHAESAWNAERRFQGRTDVGLSDSGRAQAEALARALARRRVGTVYSSPLRRARETAEMVAKARGLAVTLVDELRELSLGAWEGRTVDDVLATEADAYRNWRERPYDCPPPAGEHIADVVGRILPVMERIVAAHPDGEEALVVAHGGVISVYLCHLLGLPLNALWQLAIGNASLSVVDPPRVLTVNDTAHLEGLRPW
ncbi:MAG: histidine phosphatase family protein [Candidatus Rokubacteria bacterium]|nr:histidine phosphatase family protein [Candidatus Rokubacteria bacterium]